MIDAARTIEKFGVYLDNFEKQVALNYVAGLNIPQDEGTDLRLLQVTNIIVTKKYIDLLKEPKRPTYTYKEMTEYILKSEKTFPESEGYKSYKFELTYEDEMRINAELDKITDEFYVDEDKKTDTREKNAPVLPVRVISPPSPSHK